MIREESPPRRRNGLIMPSVTLDPQAVRQRLLAWYRREHRALPWRSTADPYAILVSEVMLQQTRVEQALPYYEAFMRRFPDVDTLARAEPDEVLELWQGLGYYRRALQLHAAAREIAARYGGRVPDNEEELRALPGVGDYTAGAVLSIAYGRPRPAVDGNVLRVLARLTAEEGVVDDQPVRRRLRALAEALVDAADPGAFNQALMELGATVCRPRQPACARCPLAGLCAARAAGDPERLPRRRRRDAVPELVRVAVLAHRRDGALLLGRRPKGGLLGGLWELPAVDGTEPGPLLQLLAPLGVRHAVEGPLGELRLAFSHRRWRLHILAVPAVDATREGEEASAPVPGYERLRWVRPEALPSHPMPAALRTWVAERVDREFGGP